MQTIKEVAENFSSDSSLNQLYKKAIKNKSWLVELLEEAYVAIAENVKLRSETRDYVDFDHACTVMDRVVIQVSCIYEEYIRRMKNNV